MIWAGKVTPAEMARIVLQSRKLAEEYVDEDGAKPWT